MKGGWVDEIHGWGDIASDPIEDIRRVWNEPRVVTQMPVVVSPAFWDACVREGLALPPTHYAVSAPCGDSTITLRPDVPAKCWLQAASRLANQHVHP